MDWTDLEKHFSAARLRRYLASCNGDEARAATAYVNNMLLAEAMMPMLNVLEVALKNGTHQRLTTQPSSNYTIKVLRLSAGWTRNFLHGWAVMTVFPQRGLPLSQFNSACIAAVP